MVGSFKQQYASALNRCKSIGEVTRLRTLLKAQGQHKSTFLGNHLVQMYGKCGSVYDALSVFYSLGSRNIFSWTIMVGAYAQNRHLEEAKGCFDRMPEQSAISCTYMMDAYAQTGRIRDARMVFQKMTYRSIISWNCLISAFALNGHFQDAFHLFKTMPDTDVISWNAMITAYGEAGDVHRARYIFHEMPERDIISWNAILAANAQKGNSQEARSLFDKMPHRNSLSWSTVISAHASSGQVEDARLLLEESPEPSCVVSWSSMIAAYARSGDGKKALELFAFKDLDGLQLDEVSVANVLGGCEHLKEVKLVHGAVHCSCSCLVGTALVAAYGRLRSSCDAKKAFDSIEHRDVVAWTSMLTAYTQNGFSKEAMDLFRRIDLHGFRPDMVSYLCLVDACAAVSDLRQADVVNACVVESGFHTHVILGTALVNMYGKCGRLDRAQEVFNKLHERNTVSWNTIIVVHAQNGHGKDALMFFHRMNLEGEQPNSTTFTIVLSTCSHGGLLEEGRRQFMSMSEDSVPTVDHYACMVDLLGRAGRPLEAEELTEEMPYNANSIVWKTLLGASMIHKDKERGIRAADNALRLDGQNYAPLHIAMSHFKG